MISESDKVILNSIFNPLTPINELPCESLDICLRTDTNEETEFDKEISRLEIESINLAESGNFTSAKQLLTQAIQLSPKRASLYNNRAQVYRLEGLENDALFDLKEAIALSEGGTGKSGCQALCQRALIYEKLGRREDAIKDWTTAARNGSEYAKSMVVKMNPYAALCNQMLSIVMRTLNNPPLEAEENIIQSVQQI